MVLQPIYAKRKNGVVRNSTNDSASDFQAKSRCPKRPQSVSGRRRWYTVMDRSLSKLYTSVACGYQPSACLEISRDRRFEAGLFREIERSTAAMLSEKVRCSMFCGGIACRYDSFDAWPDTDMAIRGIFSHWITDDIVAMARPNRESMTRFAIVEQFKRFGIKSVINLQRSGEHSACGPPLNDSGFSYDPTHFMRDNVYYFNFPMRDYGILSVSFLLDMVKVATFALLQGKLAIHCHAGLGRTGLLIACYLVFSRRLGPLEAVGFVRSKRNKSVQTRRQVEQVVAFAEFIRPSFTIFPSRGTLSQFLLLQRRLLHGCELRRLRHVPKVVSVTCQRLLALCGRGEPVPCTGSSFCKCLYRANSTPIPSSHCSSPDSVAATILQCHGLVGEDMRKAREEANSSATFFDSLASETDVRYLVQILLAWLTLPETPILDKARSEMLRGSFGSIDKLPDEDTRSLVAYVFNFVDGLGLPDQTEELKRTFIDQCSQVRKKSQLR